MIYIACSYNHCIAISTKGAAYGWGVNKSFQLGLGYISDYIDNPVRIQGSVEQKILIQAVCGNNYSALLTL